MKTDILLLIYIFFISLHMAIEVTAQSYLVPNDLSYSINKDEKFSYILPDNQLKYFNLIKSYSDLITPLYEKDFHWILDERTSVVLASDHNQIANAFATSIPNNLTVYYVGGVEFLESSATSSWIYVLSTHERSHVYQLNLKRSPSLELKNIFGNQVYFFPIVPIPIFLTPNALLPTFILEGNAVFNESRFQSGGRLFSGEVRAMTLNLIFSGRGSLKYLMNNSLFFPYGPEKYYIGGYFQNHLAEQFGEERVNSFFYHSANRYLNPLYLKSSFAEAFYSSYEKLYDDFIRKMTHDHWDFTRVKGKVITESKNEILFNKINNKVIFLTQNTAKDRKKLNFLDTETLEHHYFETTLPSGKIFEIEPNKFYSVSSQLIDRTKLKYSLFDENYTSLSEFEGKYVTDIKGPYHSYFLMKDSLDSGKLYVNDRFITMTDSKPLLDNDGNVYYFKQNKERREFYKNDQKLFSFLGHYAILSDIGKNGEIYFISNTKNGSSLYCYFKNQITKVLRADNVVRAINLENYFLVSSLEENNYQVSLVEKNFRSVESPYVYDYPAISAKKDFFSEADMELKEELKDSKNNSDLVLNNNTLIKNFSSEQKSTFDSYFSLQELRFSSYQPSYSVSNSYSTSSSLLLNDFNFIDPLFWTFLNFGFSVGSKESSNYLNFSYHPYLLKFNYSFLNETSLNSVKFFPSTGNYELDYRTQNSQIFGLEYLFYQKGFYTLNSGVLFEKNSKNNLEYDNWYLYLTSIWNEEYLLNYLSRRLYKIQPYLLKSNENISLNLVFEMNYYLGSDYYLSSGYAYSDDKNNELKFQYKKPFVLKKSLSFSNIVSTINTENSQQIEVEFLKEIPFHRYYYRVPVSVRRIAPYLGFQRNDLRRDFDSPRRESLSILSFGLEAELLLFHQSAARVRFVSSRVEIENKKEDLFSILFNLQ